MPLMVYIGEKNQTRRSWKKRVERTEKAEGRGYTRDIIDAMKRVRSRPNRGSGASSWSASSKPAPLGEPARNRGGEPAKSKQARAGGPSSSSSWSWEDPSQTAWQDSTGWGTDWSSKVNWGWKQ